MAAICPWGLQFFSIFNNLIIFSSAHKVAIVCDSYHFGILRVWAITYQKSHSQNLVEPPFLGQKQNGHHSSLKFTIFLIFNNLIIFSSAHKNAIVCDSYHFAILRVWAVLCSNYIPFFKVKPTFLIQKQNGCQLQLKLLIPSLLDD